MTTTPALAIGALSVIALATIVALMQHLRATSPARKRRVL